MAAGFNMGSRIAVFILKKMNFGGEKKIKWARKSLKYENELEGMVLEGQGPTDRPSCTPQVRCAYRVDQRLQAFDRQPRRGILVTFMMSRGRAGKIWSSGEEFDTFHY